MISVSIKRAVIAAFNLDVYKKLAADTNSPLEPHVTLKPHGFSRDSDARHLSSAIAASSKLSTFPQIVYASNLPSRYSQSRDKEWWLWN